ncbi:MAG: tyrosine--tRNA ligase [Acidobacteriaceae bacterium]
MKTDASKIEEILSRGVDEVIDREHLHKRMLRGEKLRIKLGIDPTSPNIHIGRAIPLLKMRDFQELGHQIVLIIGDFTGLIGDTSDKESERPMLAEEKIKANMKDYAKQAGKLLDMKKVEVRYNSEWLAKLDYEEIGKQADQFSLAEFIARENIRKRLDEGRRISLRELLYPLLQGYDSVAIKADVELGGTDQRFNLLAGRTLQEFYKQQPQDILMTELIPGLDGRKMSSSWGNVINLMDEPNDMFGKVMSITDDLIITYFTHCTRFPMDKVAVYEKQLKAGKVNPRDIKIGLAFEIVKLYSDEKSAKEAKENFISVFQKKEMPDEIEEVKIKGKEQNIVEILILSKLATSKTDARRLIEQKSVKIDGAVIGSIEMKVKKGDVIQKGKRFFVRIV